MTAIEKARILNILNSVGTADETLIADAVAVVRNDIPLRPMRFHLRATVKALLDARRALAEVREVIKGAP